MQVHEGPPDLHLLLGGRSPVEIGFGFALGESVLAGVDKRPREAGAKVDVVRAAGPLESFGRSSAHRPVAAAVVQLTGRASPRQSVRHAGGRNGVHEGRLSSACIYARSQKMRREYKSQKRKKEREGGLVS